MNVETGAGVTHPFSLWKRSARGKKRTEGERGSDREKNEKVSRFSITPRRIVKHFLWGKGKSFCIELSIPRRNQLFYFPGGNRREKRTQ